MLFNSLDFVLLVLITFVIYYLPLVRRFQIIILILSSFVFYANNQPYLLSLLVLSALINTVFSYLTYYFKHKHLYAAMGVILNLAVLCSFKYTKLIFNTFYDINTLNTGITEFIISIPLPIGISFFTFQGISLVLDVLRKYNDNHIGQMTIDKKFRSHLKKTFFFICFFPQLVAGPIVKAHQFIPQIKTKYLRDIDYEHVFKTLIIGYFLKMVVADNLKDQTFWIAYPWFETLSSTTLIMMLFAYSMQIFSDFAGYSLIAIGVASLFGYRLPKNFNFPYISQSFSEFWRRWHISLSSWLRDYLYFPLGGNRKGTINTYRNLFIVMFLGGLWHGAAWSYAAWGTWHGLALAIERLLNKDTEKEYSISIKFIKILFVFSFVTISWMFFKLNNFSHVILFVNSVIGNMAVRESFLKIAMCVIYSLPVIIYHLFYLAGGRVNLILKEYEFVAYSILLFFIIFNGGDPGEFIYFQF